MHFLSLLSPPHSPAYRLNDFSLHCLDAVRGGQQPGCRWAFNWFIKYGVYESFTTMRTAHDTQWDIFIGIFCLNSKRMKGHWNVLIWNVIKFISRFSPHNKNKLLSLFNTCDICILVKNKVSLLKVIAFHKSLLNRVRSLKPLYFEYCNDLQDGKVGVTVVGENEHKDAWGLSRK